MAGQPDPATLPDGTHLGRTALRVPDPGTTAEFYRTVVGLELLGRTGGTATLGVDGTPLLVLEGGEDPAGDGSGTGLYHNAFRVPSRGALGDALGRIRDGWRLDGASDHRVSEALYFTDPEGNGVEMYRDFPREEWPTAPDGAVRMATDPLDLDALAADAAGDDGAPAGDDRSPAGDDRAPPGTDLGHVHLSVSSLGAFEEFYVDALGFEPRASVPGARFVAAGGYHHHVGANTWHRGTGSSGGRGLSWFEVVVPGSSALDAVRARLADRGISVADVDGGLEVTDPDGIAVRLRAGTTARD